MADKMKSFFNRLTKKDAASTAAEEFTRLLNLVRANDIGVDTIDLSDENCPTQDNLADMCLAIQGSRHIVSFRVRRISVEPAIEFFASLCSTTSHLTELRLTECSIGEHECNCLVAALLNNRSIRTLALGRNNITSTDSWAQLLSINKVIESLDLSHNRLCVKQGSDKAMQVLCDGIKKNPRLRDLYLAGNGFQESSVAQLLRTVTDHGDTMGLRNVDLVNDQSLSQQVRDALSTAMARAVGAAPIPGLRVPRVAEDPDSGAIEVVRKQRQQQHQQGQAAADTSPSTTTNGAGKANPATTTAVVSKSNSAEEVHQQHHHAAALPGAGDNNYDNDDSISNFSMSTGGGGDLDDAAAAALRAAKLAKLKDMKARHAAEIKRREAIEVELREQISQLISNNETLTQQLASAKAVAAAATAAAAASAAAVPSSSSNGDNGTSDTETKLREALNQQAQQHQQIQEQLQQQLENMVAKHVDEVRRKDEEAATRRREHDSKVDELAALVANFGEKSEQSRQELSAARKEIETERAAKTAAVQAAQEERESLNSRIQFLESQLAATEQRSDALTAANKALEAAASEQIARLRSQLEAALSLNRTVAAGAATSTSSSAAPSAKNDDDGDDSNGDDDQQQQKQREATATTAQQESLSRLLEDIATGVGAVALAHSEAQTDPLPEVQPIMTPPPPSVPSLDISSVTRFKMQQDQIEKANRRGSDDSFVGSDGEATAGGVGKRKYVPKSRWVKDEAVSACMVCHKEFGIINRRSHCRNCGIVVCGSCSEQKAKIPDSPYANEKVKVCDPCYRSLLG